MERSLKVARIFSQGEYQNITVEDTVDHIPEEFALDENFIKLVSYLQLLNVERRYNKYEILRAKYRTSSPEEANALIEDEIASTKEELSTYIQSK